MFTNGIVTFTVGATLYRTNVSPNNTYIPEDFSLKGRISYVKKERRYS